MTDRRVLRKSHYCHSLIIETVGMPPPPGFLSRDTIHFENSSIFEHLFEVCVSTLCYTNSCVDFGFYGVVDLVPTWASEARIPNLLVSLLWHRTRCSPVLCLASPQTTNRGTWFLCPSLPLGNASWTIEPFRRSVLITHTCYKIYPRMVFLNPRSPVNLFHTVP